MRVGRKDGEASPLSHSVFPSLSITVYTGSLFTTKKKHILNILEYCKVISVEMIDFWCYSSTWVVSFAFP